MPKTPTLEVPIVWVPLATLRPHPRNDGHHSHAELAHLKQSLTNHGVYRNVVVANEGTILAGHGVVQAAQELGHTQILARRMPYGPHDPQALQILVGDNHIARLREQDDAALVALLEDLSRDDPLALLGTGFDEAALDALIAEQALVNGTGGGDAGRDAEPQVDRAEELREEWGVELGQLWACGKHRIICGDCTEKAVVEQLLTAAQPAILIADPPYGMQLDTSYANSVDNPRKGIRKSRGYPHVIGDDRPFDPSPIFALHSEIQEQFWWGADYYRDWLPAGCSWTVWDKRASVEMVDYSSSEFELCWSRTPHHRIILRVPWFGLIGTEQQDTHRRLHATQKPLGVLEPFVSQYTDAGSIVYDPFLGSGTTLIACTNLGRICYGCEIDPGYVAVTLQRWADVTNEQPKRLE